MTKKTRKNFRKLSAREKQMRRDASLLKNKISLVEFVSQHPKTKESSDKPLEIENQVTTETRKSPRKLTAREKQMRKDAILLKNKINLVEFVSKHPKIKEEPPDEPLEIKNQVASEKRKSPRKLTAREKKRRKDVSLLKNKINLVEFVSEHSKIKEEPPDEPQSLDINIKDDVGAEITVSKTDEQEDGQNNGRSDFVRARQRLYSKRWRQKPENRMKIRQYKREVRQKLKAAKLVANSEKPKFKAKQAKHKN